MSSFLWVLNHLLEVLQFSICRMFHKLPDEW